MPAIVDGQGRSDVLSLPKWTLFIRIAQLVLAFILLVLTAFSASKLGSGAAGFGLTWFTFIFTVLYFVWLGVSLTAVPQLYHPIAHLPVEILLNIFWLSSWAVLASEASSIGNLESYLGHYYTSRLPSAYKNALNCVKAAAALGALEWVLFCITLAFLVIAFLEYQRNGGLSGGVGAGAGVGGAKAETEMQNYNNGAGAPPGGVPAGAGAVDPATGYPVQQQQPVPGQEPYGQADPNAQAGYPQQGYPQQGYPQQPYAQDPSQQAAYQQPPQGYTADPNANVPQQPYQQEYQHQQAGSPYGGTPAPGQEGVAPPQQQYQEQPVTGAPQPPHPNQV